MREFSLTMQACAQKVLSDHIIIQAQAQKDSSVQAKIFEHNILACPQEDLS